MAIIGLLSDSHARAETTAAAVTILIENGAEILIHLGDVGTQAVIDALLVSREQGGGLIPVHLVFGNTDYDIHAMQRYAGHLGVHVDHPAGRLSLGDKTLAFTHGHLERLMQQAIAESVDYLCHGHTHIARDERIGDTRIINPGALHRAGQYSVALLDTASDSLRFYPVAKV